MQTLQIAKALPSHGSLVATYIARNSTDNTTSKWSFQWKLDVWENRQWVQLYGSIGGVNTQMRISRRDASYLIKRTRKQNKDIKDAEADRLKPLSPSEMRMICESR